MSTIVYSALMFFIIVIQVPFALDGNVFNIVSMAFIGGLWLATMMREYL